MNHLGTRWCGAGWAIGLALAVACPFAEAAEEFGRSWPEVGGEGALLLAMARSADTARQADAWLRAAGAVGVPDNSGERAWFETTALDQVRTRAEVEALGQPGLVARRGDWTLRWWPLNAEAVVVLTRGDEVVFSVCGWVGPVGAEPRPWAPPGREPRVLEDIDGDGDPDVLLVFYSGGAHCCHTLLHVDCGEEAGLVAFAHTEHGEPVYRDVDDDGRFEVLVRDATFAYWNECYALSPQPEVIYRIRGGRYVLAADLMHRFGARLEDFETDLAELARIQARLPRYLELLADPSTDWNALRGEDAELAGHFGSGGWRAEGVVVKSAVWGVFLELAYAGRVDDAFAAVERVWPPGVSGRGEFLRELVRIMSGSAHARDLPWIGELLDRAAAAGP